MSRRDDEPITIAQFATREKAEEVWALLLDNDIPANVLLSPAPLGGRESHRVEVARKDAADALRIVSDLTET